MADLIISKKNEVYLKLQGEPYIFQELSERFTFEVPNAKFMPQYRKKYWDGKIRLFSTATGEIYVGLLDKIIDFCDQHKYTYKFVDSKFYGVPFEVNELISREGVSDYMKKISSHDPRDYQIDGVYSALKYNRKLLISPTASGKSLMIYSLVRYFTEKNMSTLIVVPTTSLVEQMYKDFTEYGWNSEEYCHKIYSGREKITNQPVVITTWQSIYKLDKSFFKNFNVVIGDEAHLFKSKSLVDIMTKLLDCKYRFGFTGTLDGSQTHKWILEGLFGPSYNVTKIKELIDRGYLSKLDIKILLLKHNYVKFENYGKEIQFLIQNDHRNTFIKNLALDLKGNTLILFTRVESHGKVLYDLINNSKDDKRKLFFVHGGVDTEDRENVRSLTETEENAIIVASYGTFSTGINIRNLHNIIFASPGKSRIRNLQSIGRVLRKGTNKIKAILYDISDDISNKKLKNYTLNHLMERIKIYNEEKFNYEIITIDMKKP
jgi:superfamily II DNA or RNA helicase